MQPLRREVVDERPRPRVGHHAPDFSFEHHRLVQPAGDRHVQQLIVGNAAPQEEGQPRRQLEIADAIRRVRRDAGRIRLDAEEEVGAHQHARQGHLDAGVEAALGVALLVERQRAAKVGIGHRPPVRPLRQRRQDLPRGALVLAPNRPDCAPKIRRRLGVSPGPFAPYGPTIEIE